MSGLAQFLLGELATISAETRRRWPEVREAADKAADYVKEHQQSAELVKDLAASEDVLQPLFMACNAKITTPKLTAVAVGCMHRLITQSAVPRSLIANLLFTLNETLGQAPEIQLRVLQTVLPLLTNYEHVHGELLGESLLLCFRLHDSKTPMVSNTAAATLRQMVVLLFERMAAEEKEMATQQEDPAFVARYASILPQVVNLKPCALDAFLLFQDLCLLTNGDKPVFLRIEYLNRTFGIELIDSILSAHSHAFLKYPEFTALLKERVCPLIIRTVTMKNPFPQVVRLMRVIATLIKYFSSTLIVECELFLGMFGEILRGENPFWQKVLCMEIIRGICAEATLLRSIYEHYDDADGAQKLFAEIVQLLARCASSRVDFMETAARTSGATISCLSVDSASVKMQCIDQLEKTDPPQLPENYLTFLILSSITHIAESCASLVLPVYLAVGAVSRGSADTPLSAYSPSQSLYASMTGTLISVMPIVLSPTSANRHPLAHQLMTTAKMVLRAAPDLLDAFACFISARLDADLFHNLLKAFQNLILVAGVFGLRGPRDEFLAVLCRQVLMMQSEGYAQATTSITPTAATAGGSAGGGGTVASFVSDVSGLFTGSSGGNAQPAPASPSVDAVSVAFKSSTALRVLLNISHILATVLEDYSWMRILDTINQMARAIHGTADAQHARLKRTATSQEGLTETEVNAIAAGIQQLFDSTKWMPDASFCSFTRAMSTVSAETCGIPNLPPPAGDIRRAESMDVPEIFAVLGTSTADIASLHESPSPSDRPFTARRPTSRPAPAMKLDEVSFLLDKLRDVLLINIRRVLADSYSSDTNLTRCWRSSMQHFVDITNAPVAFPLLKAQSCGAICQVVSAVLTYVVSVKKSEENRSGVLSLSDDTQQRILMPLHDLMAGDNLLSPTTATSRNNAAFVPSHQLFSMQQDVQKAGLESLNKLLQMGGQYLTSTGYAIVFRMFTSVGVWTSKKATVDADEFPAEDRISPLPLIRIAFPSLQLICTDFLQSLSAQNMQQCIEAVGSFAAQIEDINISLTSINLLWTLSDTARTICDTGDSTYNEGRLPPQPLWHAVLKQLSDIAMDPRSAVRNTATQTIFRVISMTYGSLWSVTDWEHVLGKVVLPMVYGLRAAATANRQSVLKTQHLQVPMADHQADEGTADASQPIHILPAPSATRLATLKQWDETKILALNGISQTLQEYLIKLLEIPNFRALWIEFLQLFHAEFCGMELLAVNSPVLTFFRQSHEVSIATIRAFRLLLRWPRTNQSALNGNEDLRRQINMLWWNAYAIWDQMAIGSLLRKRAHIWSLGPSAPMSGDGEKPVVALVDLLYRNETIIALVCCFPELWTIIAPSAGASDGLRRFGPEDLRNWQEVLRGLVTFFDFSYSIARPELRASFGVEITTVQLTMPVSYDKIHASDAESLSMLQNGIVELFIGSRLFTAVKKQAPDDTMLAAPYLKDNEKVEPIVPAVWESVMMAHPAVLKSGGDVAQQFLTELHTWISLAFRKSHHLMNLKSFADAGGSTRLLSVGSPMALSMSVLAPLKVEPASPTKMEVAGVQPDVQVLSGIKSPTFIAMAYLLLMGLEQMMTETSKSGIGDVIPPLYEDVGIYRGEVVDEMLDALAIPMSLKYDCCTATTPINGKNSSDERDYAVRLWKRASRTFVAVARTSLTALRQLDLEKHVQRRVWTRVVQTLSHTLLSGSLPPPDMTLDDFDSDEDFDIALLQRFSADILPMMTVDSCSDDTVAGFTALLSRCSQLWDDKEGKNGVHAGLLLVEQALANSTGPGSPHADTGIPTVVPVVRERLAKTCLTALFRLCDSDASAEEEFGNASPAVRSRLAAFAAPVVLGRCLETIGRWIKDKPLHGSFPFPRIRTEEMILILRQISRLKMHTEGASALQAKYGDFCSGATKTEARTSAAHLFYLYDSLVRCTQHCTAVDAIVEVTTSASADEQTTSVLVHASDLLRACLHRVGEVMGMPRTLATI